MSSKDMHIPQIFQGTTELILNIYHAGMFSNTDFLECVFTRKFLGINAYKSKNIVLRMDSISKIIQAKSVSAPSF
jgi:hypothetical protein